ncbi:MAG: amino acid ABC transporter substrate-binding protein [Caldilineaceae bacterium]|nr:amino acid ABC transporter substrate-binding protein [Caldilineaceae bacterium]
MRRILHANRPLLIAIGLGILLLLLILAMTGERLFPAPDRTWRTIQERGVWRVGMDPSFPPFEMLDEAGRPIGYDVDLAQAIAKRLGVRVEIVAMGFDGLVDAVQVGRVDSVISALPFDPRLTQDVRYTSSYFEAGTRLVVMEGSVIGAVEDLGGRRVAVEWGSAGDAEVRRLQREDPSIERMPYPTPDEAIAALLSGESEALVVDGVTLRLAQGRGDRIVAVGPPFEGSPYVVVLPLHARLLHEAIEDAFTALREEGVLEGLEQRWFSAGD